ncbi:hypothetical protein S245_023436 [Arachis hypogaea]
MARLLLLHPVLSAVVLSLLVVLSTPGASARPCRSFLISSYTFSLPSSDDPSLPSSSTLTTFTEIHSFRHFPAKVFFTRSISDSSVGMTEPRRRSLKLAPPRHSDSPLKNSAPSVTAPRTSSPLSPPSSSASAAAPSPPPPYTSSGPRSPAVTITITTITLTTRKMRRSIALRS